MSLNIQFADWVVGWAKQRLEARVQQLTGDGPGKPKTFEEYLAKVEECKLLRDFITACEKEARKLQG
jgi:hypothetical protein